MNVSKKTFPEVKNACVRQCHPSENHKLCRCPKLSTLWFHRMVFFFFFLGDESR